MRYTLITPAGKIRQFYVLAVAELYQQIEGGTLITDQLYAEAYADLLVDA